MWRDGATFSSMQSDVKRWCHFYVRAIGCEEMVPLLCPCNRMWRDGATSMSVQSDVKRWCHFFVRAIGCEEMVPLFRPCNRMWRDGATFSSLQSDVKRWCHFYVRAIRLSITGRYAVHLINTEYIIFFTLVALFCFLHSSIELMNERTYQSNSCQMDETCTRR